MPEAIVVVFTALECAYLLCLLTTLWLYSRPVDLVDTHAPLRQLPAEMSINGVPEVIVFYPVLRELESTMRTTMLGLSRADYPNGSLSVVAIPNRDDAETIEALHRVADEYPFLKILPVPPTNEPSWNAVWEAWGRNDKAYWWHRGKRAFEQALPAKKTRQLVYALYTVAAQHPHALLSYIDADSVVPQDYFHNAAIGSQQYDVLQNTNVAGNALQTWASSMFAMDHMLWDGSLYQHMGAHGKHPYYVLGKGLFFRISDLLELGGFNPWLTIEDPEVGMRLWANGRRLGVIRSPLIEEVPDTFSKGITQRKRWIAGFFQSLASPLKEIGMSPTQRFRARVNLVPCASLLLNPIGVVLGIWALVAALTSSTRVFPLWVELLCFVNLACAVFVLALGQRAAFTQTRLIWNSRRERLHFMFRVNPLFVLIYWIWWAIPLTIGFSMWLRDEGLTWERTEKTDANHELIRAPDAPFLTESDDFLIES
jgi:cellulose synthase/poly-beta-1,6-N-acetylglucosamine synthase-like glycosyltransferase